MDVIRTSKSWIDIQSIIDYFDSIGAQEVANRFIDAVDATIEFIQQFPDLGAPWESSKPPQKGLRYRLVAGFENYLVVYRHDGRNICILRILHGKRNLEGML
jgi:toxin ParE1/3/4